jgi:hypothetical protein
MIHVIAAAASTNGSMAKVLTAMRIMPRDEHFRFCVHERFEFEPAPEQIPVPKPAY